METSDKVQLTDKKNQKTVVRCWSKDWKKITLKKPKTVFKLEKIDFKL